MTHPAISCKSVKSSPRMMKAKTIPKKEEVAKITPVFIDPISLNEKRNSNIERATLKAPTDNM